MQNSIANIPGLLENFSQTSDHAELYEYKASHKVAWLQPDGDMYWLRDLYDMNRGWSVSKKSMRTAARILSRKTGKLIISSPW